MSIDLKGKWALVTGSSRGIGVQVARALAQQGCNLVLHSRDKAGTANLERELGSQARVVSLAAELGDQSQVDRLAQEALQASGGIDVLYNNAAIMTPYRKDLATVSADDYRRSFEVNVISPIRLTFALLPSMQKRKFGRIVQVTSGIKNEPELMAYAASKAALDKFVMDMAPRLRGTGVTMNLLDPGWLRTDLGGPNAPNAVESVLPGALVPVLAGDEMHGHLVHAQDFAGR
jgi:NAD(P)-dependent dehydrogenase (short-subunit alcohol dehydrogenase family)